MLCSIDSNHEISKVSKSCLNNLGYDSKELIGKNFTHFLTESSKKIIKEIFSQFLDSDEIIQNVNIQILKENGQVIDVVLSAIMQKDESQAWSGALISLDDVTELNQTKKELEDITENFQCLYQNTFAITHSLEIDKAEILNISDHWLHTFGYEREEIVGHRLDDFMLQESQNRFEQEVLVPCVNDGGVKEVPLKLYKKNDDVVHVVLSATTERDDTGTVRKAFFILEDVSQLKKAHDELKEEELKKQAILNAIRAPLKESIQQLVQLKQRVPQDFHDEIDDILSNLSDEKLFRPYFTNPNFVVELDMEINKWLIKEYSTFATSYSYFPGITAPPPTKDESLGPLNSLKFNAFNYIENQLELIDLYVEMFKHFNLLETFKISEESIRLFASELKSEYRNVPYHNFLHAFDVTQMTFYFLTRGGLSNYLTDLDILAFLISAFAHDLCHPGLSNNYHELTQSPLALKYNDQSILENHHISNLFKIIHHSGCNILESLSPESTAEVRKIIISNILATDMKQHFDILSSFSKRIKESKSFDRLNREDRLLLMKLALKCGDVCNPARPYRVAKKWTKAVMDEFFHQGDLEKASGLPISPFMDRDAVSIPKCQAAFIEFIVKPLYGSFALVFPNIQECMRNLEENSQTWHKALAKEKG
ncbi:MAG: PAS domain S-box-containing protein [Chlamydiales bacterium]|jgi:PAS domain S-box-containing protein